MSRTDAAAPGLKADVILYAMPVSDRNVTIEIEPITEPMKQALSAALDAQGAPRKFRSGIDDPALLTAMSSSVYGAMSAMSKQSEALARLRATGANPVVSKESQESLLLDEDESREVSNLIAAAGKQLYWNLFRDSTDEDLEKVIKQLEAAATAAPPDRPLRLVIATSHISLPWQYLHPHGRDVTAEKFWGLRFSLSVTRISAGAPRHTTPPETQDPRKIVFARYGSRGDASVGLAQKQADQLRGLIKVAKQNFLETDNGSRPTPAGYIRFILHQFNHRHVNAVNYLTTYSKGSSRKIDLVVPSMVDYDWWLAHGKPTPTPLSEQVDLMGRIFVLLGGRVHGFVSFCPFRELMTTDASGMGDAMRLVKHAIETRGFIGVKLYPPMGFAPLGNTGRSEWKGKPSLPDAAANPDFGKRLDAAMISLFKYCVANDVPIMAHTNHSNGPYEEFKALAGSEYWQVALDTFKGLRVSFGHFGDTDLEDHGGKQTRAFLKLMTTAAGTPGANAFADSGYSAGVLLNQIKMRDILRKLYAAENRVMLERLMFGTDWTMILPQMNVERYLSDFMQVIERVETAEPGIGARGTTLADAFFGANAVEFLGLRSGRGNRKRLDAFYGTNNVPSPDWMRKVG